MKAAQITDYGGPEVMQITYDAPKPTPSEGQVLVEVRAASVNPFDLKVKEGKMRQMGELEFPAILGGDVAGIVVAIGDGVTDLDFSIGEAVYGQAAALSGHGSFAEFTPVKASQLAVKPSKADFVTAAAMPLVSVSAYQAIVDHMQLRRGQKILIHGGAGGIGSVAIQLAKDIGAHVITTARAEDTSFVRELGADDIINYLERDFATTVTDCDAVFDTVGGDTTVKSYQVLKAGGHLVSMVERPNDSLVHQYKIHYTAQFTQVTTARLQKIAELFDAGKFKVHIDKTFPLDQTAEALEYLKTGHPRGKVVLQVSG